MVCLNTVWGFLLTELNHGYTTIQTMVLSRCEEAISRFRRGAVIQRLKTKRLYLAPVPLLSMKRHEHRISLMIVVAPNLAHCTFTNIVDGPTCAR